MKLEFDIPDIQRDEVVEAIARSLLGEWTADPDDESGGGSYIRKTALCDQLSRAVRARIDQVAREVVEATFDAEIKARIGQAVDNVLADGWARTDSYGNAVTGGRVDLKGRISEVITEKKREGYNDRTGSTLAEALVKDAVTKVFSVEMNKEIEALKSALGVRS